MEQVDQFFLPPDGFGLGFGVGFGVGFESPMDLLPSVAFPGPFVPVGRFCGCASKGTSMTDLPLSERLRKADADTLKEILREAELHLASQQTVALAADQRAMTFVGFLSAAIVVLVGAAASLIDAAIPHTVLGVICLWVAAGLMAAVLLALVVAAPSSFDFAGSSPSDWVDDIEAGHSLERSLAEQCQHHAEAIADNHERMDANGKRMWTALRVAVGTILVGAVAFVVALAFG